MVTWYTLSKGFSMNLSISVTAPSSVYVCNVHIHMHNNIHKGAFICAVQQTEAIMTHSLPTAMSTGAC